MADLTALGFFVCIILYVFSRAYAGIFFLLACISIYIILVLRTRYLACSTPVLCLILLLAFNLLKFLTFPNFTQDISFFLKSIQGYLYLLFISPISSILQRFQFARTPSRIAIKLLLLYFVSLYAAFYIGKDLSGAVRSSWLFEHNFEMVYLNTLLLIALIYSSSPIAVLSSPNIRRLIWIQGTIFPALSLSLSGFLTYTTILISRLTQKFKFLALQTRINIKRILLNKRTYVLLFTLVIGLILIYLLVGQIRGGNVGSDRLSYWYPYSKLRLTDKLFGNGIGSIMPEASARRLLLQSNLKNLLDSNGEATSLLLHSAIGRVFFDTGFLGFVVVAWNIIYIFQSLPGNVSIPFISIFMISGLSVGSFFNPLGAYSMLLGVIYVVGYSKLLFRD